MNTNYDICSKSMTKIGRYQDKYFKSGPRSKPPNWEWVFWYYDKSPLWAESRIMRALPHPYKASTKKISKLPILGCIWGNVHRDCDKRDRGRRIMRARGHYDICPRSRPDKDWNLSLASTAAQKEENLKKKKKSKFSAEDFFFLYCCCCFCIKEFVPASIPYHRPILAMFESF